MARKGTGIAFAIPEIKTHWELQDHLMVFPVRTFVNASSLLSKCGRG